CLHTAVLPAQGTPPARYPTPLSYKEQAVGQPRSRHARYVGVAPHGLAVAAATSGRQIGLRAQPVALSGLTSLTALLQWAVANRAIGSPSLMFDFDRVIERRGTHASKWDMMAPLSGIDAPDAIAMWVADMDFAAPPGVSEALAAEMGHATYGYYA